MRQRIIRFSIYLFAGAISILSSHASTITAAADGNWVTPQTWNCKCQPGGAGSTIVIPYGTTVSVTRPITVAGGNVVIVVMGTLYLSNGSIQLQSSDRITVLPGGKLAAGGLGGSIYSGINLLPMPNGSHIEGPATINNKVFPLALAYFKAVPESSDVILTWASDGEVNFDSYEVHRSYDSINFQSIGRVEGVPYSLKRRKYMVKDINAARDVVYYRLEAVDLDSVRVVFAPIKLSKPQLVK